MKRFRLFALTFCLLLLSIIFAFHYTYAQADDTSNSAGKTELNLNALTSPLNSDTNYINLNGDSTWSQEGLNNVTNLSWTTSLSDLTSGYRVQRKGNGADAEWKYQSSNYDKKLTILNIYPDNGNYLKDWMKLNYDGEQVSRGLITIVPVSIRDFNEDPNSYLKNSDGSFKYDGIYFGSSDANNWQDLKDGSVVDAVRAYGASGRGVIFGHDTIAAMWNFDQFAKDCGLTIGTKDTSNGIGSSVVSFTQTGFINQYPNVLDPTKKYNISYSHTSALFYDYNGGGTRWMKFDDPLQSIWQKNNNITYQKDTDGNIVADDNDYLVIKNNYASIMTGHTTGKATPDEAAVIVNMIYSVCTLNNSTVGNDRTAKDSAVPDAPSIRPADKDTASGLGNTLNINLNSTDNATNYDYRVQANSTSKGTVYSNVKTVPVLSNIKGFIYTLDDKADETPTVVKDGLGDVTNINAPVTDPDTSTIAKISLDKLTSSSKYLHVLAVDRSNNVSSVTNYSIGDLATSKGSISGNIWNDRNSDGLMQSNEPKMTNQQVALYRVSDDGKSKQREETTTTDASGNYSFKYLISGSFVLGFVMNKENPIWGYYPTLPNMGDDTSINSQLPVNPVTNDDTPVVESEPINLTKTDPTVSNYNAGFNHSTNIMDLEVPDLQFDVPLFSTKDTFSSNHSGNNSIISRTRSLYNSYFVRYKLNARLNNFRHKDTSQLGLQGSSLVFQKNNRNVTLTPSGGYTELFENDSDIPGDYEINFQNIKFYPGQASPNNNILAGTYASTIDYSLTDSV